jgi:hypothetical protein
MAIAEQDNTEVATPVPQVTFKFHDTATLPDGTVLIVRLPNQFQHEDITLKASAAQARRMRQLRDPESDAYVVLEADIEDLERDRDPEPLVDELTARDWWRDHLEAVKDVREQEEFASIDEDIARAEELARKPEAERPADESAELERHIAAYNEAVEKARDLRAKPRRDAFANTDFADLISQIRDSRITAEGKSQFNRTFTMWEITLGTYIAQGHEDGKWHPTERYFGDVEAVASADPEALHILANAYTNLERQFNRGAVGND